MYVEVENSSPPRVQAQVYDIVRKTRIPAAEVTAAPPTIPASTTTTTTTITSTTVTTTTTTSTAPESPKPELYYETPQGLTVQDLIQIIPLPVEETNPVPVFDESLSSPTTTDDVYHSGKGRFVHGASVISVILLLNLCYILSLR